MIWINAGESLTDGFATLGRRLTPTVVDSPRDGQVRTAFALLARQPDALLVIDNLADPSELDRPVATGSIVTNLPCRVLFTTRRRTVGRFAAVEVTVLPEEPALRLLLRHPRNARFSMPPILSMTARGRSAECWAVSLSHLSSPVRSWVSGLRSRWPITRTAKTGRGLGHPG